MIRCEWKKKSTHSLQIRQERGTAIKKNSFGNKVQGGACTPKIPMGWGSGGTSEPAKGVGDGCGKGERKAPRCHKSNRSGLEAQYRRSILSTDGLLFGGPCACRRGMCVCAGGRYRVPARWGWRAGLPGLVGWSNLSNVTPQSRQLNSAQ